MGKGIIFVGSGNLNRNKDQQSMYQYGYRNQRQKDSRTLFYKELCLESRTFPDEKGRNKKIKQLRLKYIENACSEKTMERVFIAYSECFKNKMKSKEKKKRIMALPIFLEKNKVDKRVIKRIIEIEELENEVKNHLKKDSASYPLKPETKSKSKKNEKLIIFHEMLNDYLIKSYFNDQVEMIANGLTFLESCEKHTIHIYKTDMRGLSKNWRAHKNKKLYISKNF